MLIPEKFAQTQIEVYGEEGAAWLRGLPDLIAELEAKWSIRVAPAFPNLTYNYVAPARLADGGEAVLKLSAGLGIRREMEALRLYDGHGIAALLEADADNNAMLIEMIRPGTALIELEGDEEQTRIAAAVMRELRRPAPEQHPFPTVADWYKGFARLRAKFDGGTGPLSAALVEKAERLGADLIASSGTAMLLHGDLHHWNILSATRQPWLALDPQGVVGEAEYEIGALIRNPLPDLLSWPDPRGTMARRISILAEELGFDRQRLYSWAIYQSVLSAWWSVEDHGRGWEPAMALAEILSPDAV